MKNSNEGQRVYHEVLRGITESPDDTAEERAYRILVAQQVARIRAQGGIPEPWTELP